jgi:hypothetical protein
MPAPIIEYRGPGAWGPGFGSDLSALQFDTNNWNIYNSFLELFATSLSKQIAYIAESNGELFVHYTDHSIDGPFPLPIAAFNWRGTWQSTTLYNINDVVSFSSGIYLALMSFTSGSSFATTDGSGHTWLQLMLQIPAIPTRTVSTSTFTPDLTYANSYIRCTDVAGCTFNVPNDSSVVWVQDTEMHVRDCTQSGSGVTFVAAGGVTINTIEGHLLKTATPGAVVSMKYVAANEWDLWGLLAHT